MVAVEKATAIKGNVYAKIQLWFMIALWFINYLLFCEFFIK